MEERDIIYKVTTEGDCEGRSTKTLGYCRGEKDDILKYYNDRKYYTLKVEEITIVNITSKSTLERQNLIARQKELEKELEEIKKKTNLYK